MDHIATDGQDTPVPVLGRQRQWWITGVLLALVVALFWLVPLLWHAIMPPPPPPPAPADDGTFAATDRQWATLRFETVHPHSFTDAATSDGKIAVDDDLTTPVFSPYTGRVTRIMAKAGDLVRAGTPLFTVVASEFVQAQSDLVTARGAIASAEAQYRQSHDAEARQHDLYDHKGAALKDWQQSQTDLANADAARRNAQAGLVAVQSRLRILGADGAASGHGEAIVRAPVDGIVTQRLIGLGQNIGSVSGGGNATQAFTISDFRKVWLVGNLREEDAPRAHIGQMVQLRPYVGQPLQARLTYVAPSIDPNTRRLLVRAEVPNPDGRLKPETFASFSLLTGSERQSLSVDQEAVIYEGNTARVWIALPRTHRLGLRPVTTGATVDGRVEITGGLKDGDTVVTAGSLFIDRGAKAD
jgi:cobalt-zinc-cadmium efflux system membrane fusion protein